MARVVFINLVILAVCLIALELIFGTWFTRTHALYRFTQIRDRTIVMVNPLPGGLETITYTRDEFGFRGLEGFVSEIDLLTVGGSTTDQRWLDDSQTFQAGLEDLFTQSGHPISIVNAGIDGQTTFGHIQNFSSWFEKVPDMKTRYIMYYVGLNDLLRIASVDYFDRTSSDDTLNFFKGLIMEHSALFQVYRVAKSSFEPESIQHQLSRKNIAEKGPYADQPMIEDFMFPVMEQSLTGLRTRVAQLNELTRSFGAEAIFVTQRSARWTRKGGKILGIQNYEPDFFESVRGHLPEEFDELNGVDFYNFERAVADTIMEECRILHAICLDLMARVDFNLETDFYDPIHTTPSGSFRIAEYLFEEFEKNCIFCSVAQ